jgi:hypothetical protein
MHPPQNLCTILLDGCIIARLVQNSKGKFALENASKKTLECEKAQ